MRRVEPSLYREFTSLQIVRRHPVALCPGRGRRPDARRTHRTYRFVTMSDSREVRVESDDTACPEANALVCPTLPGSSARAAGVGSAQFITKFITASNSPAAAFVNSAPHTIRYGTRLVSMRIRSPRIADRAITGSRRPDGAATAPQPGGSGGPVGSC